MIFCVCDDLLHLERIVSKRTYVFNAIQDFLLDGVSKYKEFHRDIMVDTETWVHRESVVERLNRFLFNNL